jgi:Fur family ferric uptake transcriptional regulator
MADPARTTKRQTRQGAAVEETLRGAQGFRTAQEIFADVTTAGHRIGLTTVYRHLNLLADEGRADVVHRADGEAQFRLCGESDDTGHHHHVVCRICGRSEEVSGPEVERWAERVARAAGYTDVTHTLEVFGVCPHHAGAKN